MLNDTDRAILDFEAEFPVWKFPAAKDGVVLHRFGMKPTTYYAALDRLLDDPEALAYQPATVNRLRRLRDARRAARSSSRLR